MPDQLSFQEIVLILDDIYQQLPDVTEDGEEVSESLPVITDVPVLFPRGGGFFIPTSVESSSAAGGCGSCSSADT